MVLSRIQLKDIKSFAELDLRFNVPRERGDGWSVLVGVNGTGKSTLLQSIVIGLLDTRPVTSLARHRGVM